MIQQIQPGSDNKHIDRKTVIFDWETIENDEIDTSDKRIDSILNNNLITIAHENKQIEAREGGNGYGSDSSSKGYSEVAKPLKILITKIHYESEKEDKYLFNTMIIIMNIVWK